MSYEDFIVAIPAGRDLQSKYIENTITFSADYKSSVLGSGLQILIS